MTMTTTTTTTMNTRARLVWERTESNPVLPADDDVRCGPVDVYQAVIAGRILWVVGVWGRRIRAFSHRPEAIEHASRIARDIGAERQLAALRARLDRVRQGCDPNTGRRAEAQS